MIRSKFSIKAALLASGIGLSTAGFAGSQPAAAQSYSDEYSCPAGYVYDPTYGCTLPGDAYEPYDYGYYGYPLYGAYGPDYGGRREFHHGFANGMGTSVNHGANVTVLRGSPSQGLARLGGDGFNHAMAGGASNVDHGPGFAHFGGGGFGHGMGGGFAHGIGGGFNHGVGFAHAGGLGGFHGGGGFGGGGHR